MLSLPTRRRGAVLLCVSLLWSSYARAADSSASAARLNARRMAIQSVQESQLRGHVAALADDTFEGREAGTRGGHAAGIYLGKEFQKLKLAGGAGRGYYQEFGARYRNILGLLEGSDSELKEEVIVVGAHYDHVGYGNQQNSYGPTGYIHNGADDNASGAAALVECVEALTSLPSPPPRSVLFALWDGEEKGLLGSKHWTANPTVAIDRVKLMINMDMIGRLRKDRLYVYGSRTAPGSRRLVSRQNRELGLWLDFTWEMKDNSDHHPFFERGIPVLMLHTGLHDNYHRPSDDVETLNTAGTERVARLLVGIVEDAAHRPRLASFRSRSRSESPDTRRTIERPLKPLPGRLGVSWQAGENQQNGIRVTRVRPGSAAARGGILPGDRITHLAGREITDAEEFRTAVLTAAKGVTVTVIRANPGESEDVQLELDGTPTRLGIAWRVDDAEPGSVLLLRVVPGSPADRAGLKVHDRIYQVSGRDFTTSDEFQSLVTGDATPLDLTVERQGRIRNITVKPVVLP